MCPPSIGRKALAVLVLGVGWWCSSHSSAHNHAPRRVERGVSRWDSGGAAKFWDSPPGPRSGDREGDPARGGLCVRWRGLPPCRCVVALGWPWTDQPSLVDDDRRDA